MNVNIRRYSMNIQWSEEDHIYIVTVPELPGCKTHGDTYEKAVKQAQYAIEGWIEANKALGRPIPAPRVAMIAEMLPEKVFSTMHYSMNIQWHNHDLIYVVEVPELPGCMTHGKTYEEALKNAQEAIEVWIEAAQDANETIPPPRVA